MYKCSKCGAPTRPNVDGDIRYEPAEDPAISRLRFDNARLIAAAEDGLSAAAPDLLKAAKSARAELFRLGQRDDGKKANPVMQALFAAISKAEE